MIGRLSLVKTNDKWFIMVDERCIARTITFAIHLNVDEEDIKDILVNKFNAKLDRPINGVSSELNCVDTTPWFENEDDGKKALEWLESLKLMCKIRKESEENDYPDVDIDFNYLRRNDYIEFIKKKYSN